ncbi:Uncharacterised protein [Mycobacteroides abscessus subsp. abscessus]|nr:Uncharacterised protein [Mycobacteroides abscessus subsp. abscessus]
MKPWRERRAAPSQLFTQVRALPTPNFCQRHSTKCGQIRISRLNIGHDKASSVRTVERLVMDGLGVATTRAIRLFSGSHLSVTSVSRVVYSLKSPFIVMVGYTHTRHF